jgi:hypothetical protein
MTIRVFAASSILAIGFILAPNEISARSAGFAAGPMHGAVRAPLVRPMTAPVTPPAIAGPRPFTHGAARFPQHRAPFFRHRHPFGFPGAAWGGIPWYGDYYDTSGGYGSAYAPLPPDYPPADYPPAAYPADGPPVRERVIYVRPYRPGCTSQRQTVPSEHGGERTITIVRC